MKSYKTCIVFVSFSVIFIFMHYTVWRVVSSPQAGQPIFPSSSSGKNLHHHLFSHVGSSREGTCREVFEIGKNSSHMTEFMDMAVTLIKNRKVQREFMRSVFYEVTGYSSPKMVKVLNDSSGVAGSNISLAQVGQYLSSSPSINKVGMGKYVQCYRILYNMSHCLLHRSPSRVYRAQEWRLEQVGGLLAHLPCRLREYGAREVAECVSLRPRTPTRLVYIGDSRIRQHAEVLLDLLRPLNPTVTTNVSYNL